MDYSGIIPPTKRLYVFDLDGTLVDSLDDLAAAVNWLLLSRGFKPIDRETVRRSVGNGARNLLARCFAASHAAGIGSGGTGTVVASVPPTGADFEAALADYRAYYEAHCAERTRLYPGMRDWLESLSRSGASLAVLTNKPAPATVALLRALDAERYFSVIAGPETFGALKPDPAGLVAIMALVGARPEETVMIGDSAVDVETARNAGVAACAISGGLGDEAALRASGPDYFIERA
jgi:phosphoglycolate phosphatase